MRLYHSNASAIAAAEIVGVNRNTATNYYKLFKAESLLSGFLHNTP